MRGRNSRAIASVKDDAYFQATVAAVLDLREKLTEGLGRLGFSLEMLTPARVMEWGLPPVPTQTQSWRVRYHALRSRWVEPAAEEAGLDLDSAARLKK